MEVKRKHRMKKTIPKGEKDENKGKCSGDQQKK